MQPHNKEVIHIIIGDAHAKPNTDQSRFTIAGEHVLNVWKSNDNVDINVIDMGDWEDMPSLSSYDVGKKSFEGRTYKADIAAAVEARALFNKPIDDYNAWAKQNHRQRCSITKYALGGNHFEGRLKRAIDLDRKLDGLISIEDAQCAAHGWNYVPFMEPLELHGFTYQHYFTTGIMGRPIAGESPGLSLVRKQLTSCIQGHNHLLDWAHRTRPDGSRLHGITAGCFFEHHEDYAGNANSMWWRGLLMLRDVHKGDFQGISAITLNKLRSLYVN